AIEAGSAKALNMVMLGCLFGSGDLPLSADEFLEFMAGRVPAGLKAINVRAFRSGVTAAGNRAVGSGGAWV
ncbi:MAG: hypothetical protein ACE5EX_12670, partial [Phycisphaerae bacterium]